MMADGRGRLEWGQTSWILLSLYNANRGKGSKKLTADNFNPYADKRKKPAMKLSMASVIPMIVGRGK